jgi:hypothetical protein
MTQVPAPPTLGESPVPYAEMRIGASADPLRERVSDPVQVPPRFSRSVSPGARGAVLAFASVIQAAAGEVPEFASFPPVSSR